MTPQAEALQQAKEALDANHKWHQEYDDHDGYAESELCTQNMAALAAIATVSSEAQEPEPVVWNESGPIDANALERIAKQYPDRYFLRGSGVLKLLGAIRQLEREIRLATSPAPDVRPSAQPQDSPTYLGKQCQQERRDARLPYSRICDICGFGLCIRTAQPAQDKPQEADEIDAYIRRLVMHVWREHYIKDAPEFELFEETKLVLTQLDNMLTGLTRKEVAQAAPAVPLKWDAVATEQAKEARRIGETRLHGLSVPVAWILDGAAPAVPDGWKPVPLDPTDEMMQAAWDKANELWNTPESDDPLPGHQYRAMLAAAPSAPSVSAAQPASLEKQNADLLLALQKIARRASVHPDDDAEDHKRNLHHCEAIANAAISAPAQQELSAEQKAVVQAFSETMRNEVVPEIVRAMQARSDVAAVTAHMPLSAPPAQAQAAPAVPDGCVIVSKEPTDDMEAAAEDAYEQAGITFPDWKLAYRAMIAATPSAQAKKWGE